MLFEKPGQRVGETGCDFRALELKEVRRIGHNQAFGAWHPFQKSLVGLTEPGVQCPAPAAKYDQRGLCDLGRMIWPELSAHEADVNLERGRRVTQRLLERSGQHPLELGASVGWPARQEELLHNGLGCLTGHLQRDA